MKIIDNNKVSQKYNKFIHYNNIKLFIINIYELKKINECQINQMKELS